MEWHLAFIFFIAVPQFPSRATEFTTPAVFPVLLTVVWTTTVCYLFHVISPYFCKMEYSNSRNLSAACCGMVVLPRILCKSIFAILKFCDTGFRFRYHLVTISSKNVARSIRYAGGRAEPLGIVLFCCLSLLALNCHHMEFVISTCC